MTNPRYKMSDETAAYYKDALGLLENDLLGPDAYDEVYIISNKDMQKASRAPGMAGQGTGIAFFDEAEGIQQLRGSVNGFSFYKELQGEISNRTTAVQNAAAEPNRPDFSSRILMASPPASLSFKHADDDGGNVKRAGIIFVSDNVQPSVLAGSLGVTLNGQTHISRKDAGHVDDFKKFIVLPHEAGHLVDNLGNGRMVDTTVPPAQRGEFTNFHNAEIDADEYARKVFEEATKRGLTRNPADGGSSAMDNAFNYRTLNSVDHSLHNHGAIADHATTPFMQGAPFHDKGRSSYKQAISNIDHGVNYSTAKLMGEYATGDHRKDKSFWSTNIRECFANAVDDSYAARQKIADDYKKDTKVALDTLPPTPGGISDAFRACMTGDFSNRYQLLVQQYKTTAPESPEGQLLGMYVNAAEAEIPAEEIDLARNGNTQRPAPAMGMKP